MKRVKTPAEAYKILSAALEHAGKAKKLLEGTTLEPQAEALSAEIVEIMRLLPESSRLSIDGSSVTGVKVLP